ncbi:MAG: type II secretion system protein [Planctomycetota bacterium]|nr:type II secretion system protein [Planctomycetota bacterium]
MGSSTRTTTTNTARSAFTAVELLVVIGIISLLAGMTVPAALTAMSRGAVNQSASGLLRVIAQAQDLARSQKLTTGPAASQDHYGIVIVAANPSQPAYATIVYGTALSDELLVDGRAVGHFKLGAGVRPFVAQGTASATALTGRLGWFFQAGTARPLRRTTDTESVDIGTRARAADPGDYTTGDTEAWRTFAPPLPAVAASPVCSELSLRTLDGRNQVLIQMQRVGTALTVEP